MSSYSQTARSYLSTIFGFDLNPSSSTLNRLIQLYTWLIFILVPLLANFIAAAWSLPDYMPPLISAVTALACVFTLKMGAYQLHHFFERHQPQVQLVPEQFPFWCAIRDRLREVEEKPKKNDKHQHQQHHVNEIKYSVGASMNGLTGDQDDDMMLAFDVSKSASVVVNSANQTGHDLNQIQEEINFDPDVKTTPVISKPSSVDTGLNEISRLQRKKGIRRKKTRSSQSIDHDHDDEELAPLHIPEPAPASNPVLEPAVVILRKPKNSFEPNNGNGDTSNSCTIRKDQTQCRSDPERLSVSDNKLQVGELTENLKRTHGRRNMNRTLKSVLSESSVVDPDSSRRMMNTQSTSDGPKSAENVNNEPSRDDHESNLRKVIIQVYFENLK